MHKRAIAVAIACAFSLPAAAQEYRYQNAEDATRQGAQPPAQQSSPPEQQAQPQAAPAVPAPAPCATCGTVDSIRVIEKPGEASGAGLIAGGVLGGLLGHQIGQGRGNTAATVVGAAGGAYAGHQVEKNIKKVNQYDISVRMDDGTQRTVSYTVEPGFRTGDKVKFIDGKLVRN
jgi:outer membrane lipoprotein SlyB